MWLLLFMTSVLAQSQQMMLVLSSDWESKTASLQRFERSSPREAWRSRGDKIAVVLGRHGLGWGRGMHTPQTEGPVKREGDGKAPAGIFALGTAFGEETPNPKWDVPFLKTSKQHRCVDDVNSRYYNQLVELTKVQLDWKSAEEMLRKDGLYKYGVVVEHNSAPVERGAGSCIFMHIWRAPTEGTAGCTAMNQAELVRLLHWLDPSKRPLLVQLPQSEYLRLRQSWELP